MTYDEIMAGLAGVEVRDVLIEEEQGWMTMLKSAEERFSAQFKDMERIADEWRKRAESRQ